MTAKKDKSGLTAKQARFAELVVMGCSLSDAYRGAYDASGSKPETVAVEASRLIRNPNIALTVERGRARALDAAVVTRSTLVERMERVNKAAFDRLTADDAERIDGAALNAFLKSYEALLKHVPDDSFYAVAGGEYAAQTAGDWTCNIMNDHIWFKDGSKSLPAAETWDTETVEPLPDGGVKVTKTRIR